MILKLTPHVLQGAYDLLAITEPFSRWNLPDGDDVKFKVAHGNSCFGWHTSKRGSKHLIAVSDGLVGSIFTLLRTMGHEMIHLHIAHSRIADTSEHGPVFKKFSTQVCKLHGFDLKEF